MTRPPSQRAAVGLFGSAAGLLALTYLGFVSLGLPDASFGVAWPFLQRDFALPASAFGATLAVVCAGFLVSSLSAGTLLARVGAGRLLAASTLVVAVGLSGFALAPTFALFLLAGVLVGLGGGAIDSGLNAYAAAHYSAKHMNWLHAAFGLGAFIGPLAMTQAVATGGWRPGYGVLASLMGALGILFVLTRGAWSRAGDEATARGVEVAPATLGNALRIPLVWVQMLLFSVYVGAEIGLAQWAFAILTHVRGYPIGAAGVWTALFWLALFFGRITLGLGAERIGARRLLRGGAITGFAGAALFAADPGGLGPLGLVVAGFGFAPIFPMLMHETPARLGKAVAAQAIGFQVSTAMTGSVIWPGLAGFAAASFGVGAVPVFLAAVALALLVLLEIALRMPSASERT